MKVTQVSIGRFHHFHLARQLERHGRLESIFTGYPSWKLKDELGIPKEKIRPFPWLHTLYMARGRFGLSGPWISREWAWLAQDTLDRYAARHMSDTDVLIALSSTGLHAGRAIRKHGGRYICDRGSSHIRFQDEILREEYQRWGLLFPGVDPRIIRKEEAEYSESDFIIVPSEFVRRSFLQMGVSSEKIKKIPYGARLDRFKKTADPDPHKFTVLFVGQVSLRKGFLYLLQAFEKLTHPHKQLVVIGNVSDELKPLLVNFPLKNVKFLGNVPNVELPDYYSRADVFALPSIEEGLSMVMGEAMACGCPVIATTNTGAEDLYEDGKQGFIIPIRDPKTMIERLQLICDDVKLRESFQDASVERVKKIGGWDHYGDGMCQVIDAVIHK